jgi:hypothetical protein
MAVPTDTTTLPARGTLLLMEEGAEPRPARRGFLRTLITAPAAALATHRLLIAPPAAAAAATPAFMDRYVAWLAREHAEALVEREEIHHAGRREGPHLVAFRREWVQNMPVFWYPTDLDAYAAVRAAKPSTRAAAVLTAAGCEWRA